METMLAVAGGAIVILGVVLFASRTMPYFKRTAIRQELMSQSRSCINLIQQAARNGKAASVVISTPPSPAATTLLVPYSRIDFPLQTELASGTTAYGIYLKDGSVYSQEYVKAGPRPAPRVMASHVTGLMFTGDARDPGVLKVTLRIDKPWDTSGDPTHVSTILLPNQVIQMKEGS